MPPWPRRSRLRRRNSAPASSPTEQFKPGTDPREREKNNPALLSAGNRDYDVVFVADDAFDFARQVPYHTVRARPVVGSIDLEPVAWHWTWEHNGAPQVNSRFQKRTGGRHMEGADWAAWIAVKMVVQSALRTRSTDFAEAARVHPRRRDLRRRQGPRASACGPGTTSCGRRCCWPRPMRWSRARRSRASCTGPTSSTRSATTSRRRRAS